MEASNSYFYEFSGGDSNAYSFKTNLGIGYVVKFVPSDYLFEHVSELNIRAYEMIIAVTGTNSMGRIPADVNIYYTVMAIFNHFFDNHEKVIIFVFDSFDKRHLARARKFTAWYYKAFKQTSTDLAKLDRSIPEENGDIILLSMFIHRRHPQLGAAVDAFFSMGTDEK
ncbi:DUF6169 family protein [Fibrella aquatica]|uniref:DUF6169 family protein n=1 Tax=Fibrella aquatica TaxID=3242487 RepID=UPI0035201A55